MSVSTQQLKRSFYRPDTNTEFVYNAPYEWGRDISEERLTPRIYNLDTPGEDGEYQENISPYDSRIFAARGVIIATSLTDLQSKLDTLYGAHPKNVEGKLYRRIVTPTGTVLSSRYLSCRIAYLLRPIESGLLNCPWEIGYRAADPLYRDETVVTQALNYTNGGSNTTTWTPGGVNTLLPKFTFTVTHAGTLTLSATGNAASCAVAVASTGTLIIDSFTSPRTITLGGASILDSMTGQFLTLNPTSQTVTIALSDGCTLSVASVDSQKRYPFS